MAVAFDRLPARRAGIDTYQQPVAYLRADSAVCLAEGFEAQAFGYRTASDGNQHVIRLDHLGVPACGRLHI